MGIEEEIAQRLNAGFQPMALIQEGYRKSTVYKVAARARPNTEVAPIGLWRVETAQNLATTYIRPGQSVPLSLTFQNVSATPLLVTRWGLTPAWLMSQNMWHFNDEDCVLAPGQKFRLKPISIPVPADLQFDEYELLFGATTSAIDPATRVTMPTSFQYGTPPFILKVQPPPTGQTVFISHSARDLPDVRRIARHLENNGVEAIISEDDPEPGVLLDVAEGGKFARDIDRSSLVIVLLTHEAMNSPWVAKEIQYALERHKPLIPLKETSVQITWNVEWIEFSRTESQDQWIPRLFDYVHRKLGTAQQRDAALKATIGITLAALVLGLGILIGVALGAAAATASATTNGTPPD